MKYSETITNIAPALLKAQMKIGAAKKGEKNPFFHSTYAGLGDVMEACKEALNENGVLVLQPVCGEFVETVLLHESGEWISSQTPIVPKKTRVEKPNGEITETLSDPQATGSAISYARRYGLQSMVFIPAEDDDAEKSMNRPSTPSSNGNGSYKTSYPEKKVSEAQIKLISLLLKKKGQSDQALKTKYKVESKKDLTLKQASTIIDNLNNLPDMEVEGEIDIDEVDEGIKSMDY